MKKLLLLGILSISLCACTEPQKTVEQLVDEAQIESDIARDFYKQAVAAGDSGDSTEQWRLADSGLVHLDISERILDEARRVNHSQ